MEEVLKILNRDYGAAQVSTSVWYDKPCIKVIPGGKLDSSMFAGILEWQIIYLADCILITF